MHSLQLLLVDALVDDAGRPATDPPTGALDVARLLAVESPSAAAAPAAAACGGVVELPACAVCLDRLDGSVSGVAGPGVCSHQSLMVDLARGAQHCLCWAALNPLLCATCAALHAYAHDDDTAAGSSSVAAGGSSAAAAGGGTAAATPGGAAPATPPPLSGPGTGVADGGGRAGTRVACQGACGAVSRLWTCLVCGFVGCGRYTDGSHSLRHSVTSGHRWAMELGSRRVWDYSEDTYVSIDCGLLCTAFLLRAGRRCARSSKSPTIKAF